MCLVLVYLVWGTSYPAVRVMVAPTDGSGLPTFFAAGSRLLLAGIVLFGVGAIRGRGRTAIRRVEGHRLRSTIRAGLLLSLGTSILTAFAARYVQSGVLATLMATSPLWTALLVAAASRRVPGPGTVAGLGLGLGGVALLSTGSTFAIGPGVVFAMAAAMTWSLGSWYTSRAELPPQIWLVAAVSQLVSGVVLLVVAAVSGEGRRLVAEPVSPSSWLALAYLVGVSMTGLMAYSWLLRNANPLVATTHAFVNPVVAALVGALVLAEQLEPAVLGSAALVGLGAMLVISQDGASILRRLRRVALFTRPGSC